MSFGKPSLPPAAKEVPVIPMPVDDSAATQDAARKERARIAGLSGRESTILTKRTGDAATAPARGPSYG